MIRVLPAVLLLFTALPAQALPVSIVASSGASAVAAGAGVQGDLATRWSVSPHWGLGLNGRLGGVLPPKASPMNGSSDPAHHDHLLLGLLVGPVLTLPAGRASARIALQLQHIHHTDLHDWLAQPLANLAGDSSGSVRHRTGLEASTGLTWPTRFTLGRWRVIVDADVAAGVLPSSAELAWTAGARLGVGLTSTP